MTSPSIRFASSAAVSRVKTPRSVSTSASRIGLPASAAIMPATSSRRSLRPAAIALSCATRSYVGDLRVISKACSAPTIACSS